MYYFTEKLLDSMKSPSSILHKLRMSGELDSSKDLKTTKLKMNRILVKLCFREFCESKFSG